MNLDRVTITGADDSIGPAHLQRLSKEFPFAEWGILFSGSRQGTPRYPSEEWVRDLAAIASETPLNLSAHLCGKWVRDLVLDGRLSFKDRYDAFWPIWQRLQINFRGQYHRACQGFVGAIRNTGKDWIFQHDGVNDGLISTFTNTLMLRAFPLLDRSGGAGVVPKFWPEPIWTYQGYAGGLGPENITDEIERILDAAQDSRIWIDMETRVRSDDDKSFDLDKVKRCLELAAPFVSNQHKTT